MSRKFLTRKLAMPGSVLNADNTDHVVSITVVKTTSNKLTNHVKIESDSEWKPSVPHRPQPVHLVRRQSHIQNDSDQMGANFEGSTVPVSPIEESKANAYGASNRSAFTKPGYSAHSLPGK